MKTQRKLERSEIGTQGAEIRQEAKFGCIRCLCGLPGTVGGVLFYGGDINPTNTPSHWHQPATCEWYQTLAIFCAGYARFSCVITRKRYSILVPAYPKFVGFVPPKQAAASYEKVVKVLVIGGKEARPR